jgi:two-component sensor histidine kinase
MLYESEDINRINLADYIREVAAYTSQESGSGAKAVEILVNADKVELAIDQAAPFGMALQELVRNAATHCRSSEDGGRVSITLRRDETGFELTITDSGPGDATRFFEEHHNGFGMQLVKMLAEQIGATVVPLPGPGGRIKMRVPRA